MEQYRPYGRNGYPRNGYGQYSNDRYNGCQTAGNECKKNKDCAGDCPVGMAYVPSQEFKKLYDANKGLMEGTMFPDLNLIFCGVRGSGSAGCSCGGMRGSDQAGDSKRHMPSHC